MAAHESPPDARQGLIAKNAEALVDLLAIERAAVRGWPALDIENCDGWLLRYASGGSVRANSVAALDWHGDDFNKSLQRAVAFYRHRGARPRFTISDMTQPPDLDARLDRRGWTRGVVHLTMTKTMTAPPRASVPQACVQRSGAASRDWLGPYLAGLSDDRRLVAPRLVHNVPLPRTFYSVVRDGRVIASGLSVPDGPLASVQCMATLPEARRTGAATALLVAIEHDAGQHGVLRLYLQADGSNTAAIRLYERFGFGVAGRYHSRELAE